MSTTVDHDIARIALQEQTLLFNEFTETTAWELGTRIKSLCEARKVAVTIEVRRGKETLFFYAMQGTTPNNADWVRRKRNVVELIHKSSYAAGLINQRDNTSIEQRMGVLTRDYATHGGSFPIRVKGVGCVGVVTVSGVPQREDHGIVVEALAAQCGVALETVALD
jgi:uncharacterized protein (UPF0303 family)